MKVAILLKKHYTLVFGRISAPNKKEDVNLKVFTMIKH